MLGNNQQPASETSLLHENWKKKASSLITRHDRHFVNIYSGMRGIMVSTSVVSSWAPSWRSWPCINGPRSQPGTQMPVVQSLYKGVHGELHLPSSLSGLWFLDLQLFVSYYRLSSGDLISPYLLITSSRSQTSREIPSFTVFPRKAPRPSRMGLQASLPPFLVLKLEWKISLHRSKSSVCVNRTSSWNFALSFVGLAS